MTIPARLPSHAPLAQRPSARDTRRVRAQTPIARRMRTQLAGWIVLACVAAAPMISARSASAIGILVPTQPGSSPLNLLFHRVEVEITERGAETKVTQEFENTTGTQLEATYLFPLPKGGTVKEFALWMNGKRETGTVMERGKARAIYEAIVRSARDPGLIEYVDAELFQARVFPIPANGRQRVELVYNHLVEYEAGTHRYVYPMKTDAKATSTLQDFTMTVKVKSKLPIRNLYSPTHTLATRTQGGSGVASFEKNGFSLADDFALYWQVADEDVGLTLLSTKEDDDGAGYFLLLASPKDGQRNKEIIGKRVSFVVDTSGSMAGDKMDRTKAALDYCVSQLGEDDLFNVITFGGYVESFQEKMVSASGSNKKRAREFVKAIDPLGGTNIDEALSTALSSVSGSSKVPHMVVFLTDGRPTIGETDPARILGKVERLNKDKARVFVFGVGEDVNTVLLDKLAEDHGGTQTYVKDAADIETEVKRFYDKISHPVLSNLELNIKGVRTFGTHPRALGDLFKGGQLVLLGRYREGGEATVVLTGQTSTGKKSFTYKADLAKGHTEHGFIPRLWAQRQVGMLLAEIRENGEKPGIVEEVTQLATRFGIVTPYTSYLVLEPGAQQQPSPELRRRQDVTDAWRSPPSSADPMTGGSGGRGGPGSPADDLGAFAPEESAMQMDKDASSPAGAPANKASPKKGSAKAESRSRRILSEDSGEGAVAAAKEIGRLRDSTVADKRRVATSAIRAMGRTFRYQDGFYVDESVAKADQTLRLKPWSAAFFEVLRLRPDLKGALALSERVKVKVGKGRTLVIDPAGVEAVEAKALASFVAR